MQTEMALERLNATCKLERHHERNYKAGLKTWERTAGMTGQS